MARTVKRQNFRRLATARVERTLKDIQLLGNLSNTAAYEFTDKDVDKIFSALAAALKDAKARFYSSTGVKQNGGFTLD